MQLTFTPNRPGAVALELLSGNIRVLSGAESLKVPVVARENTFAESPDTEGGVRVRSRAPLAPGGGHVYFSHPNDPTTFWDSIEVWQQTISAMNEDGGTILYLPPNGSSVTYLIESIQITSLPQDGVLLQTEYAESEFEFMAQPFGLLDPVQIAAGVTSSDPLLEVEVEGVPGSEYALAKLTLTDTEAQGRDHAVWGLDTHYDPVAPTPVLFAADDAAFTVNSAEFTSTGFAGTSASVGGVTTIRATLLPVPIAICGSGAQEHVGIWRHFARVYGTGSGTIYVRLDYKRGSSPRFHQGDWHELTSVDEFRELNLGLMAIEEAVQGDQTCEWQIVAYSTNPTPTDTLAVHLDQLVPAPCGKATEPPAEVTPTGSGGLRSAGTVADATGTGTVTWSNPSNAVSSNDSYATAVLGASVKSHYLKATNFGFTIPSGAIVTGIQVDIERKASAVGATEAVKDWRVRLVKGGSVIPSGIAPKDGSDKAASSQWPTTDTYATYGDSQDLWGKASSYWTDSDINASTFGVAIAAMEATGASGASVTASIDHIRMTVYYSEAGVQDHVMFASQSLEVRSDMVLREHSSGEWGELDSEGAYLMLPPEGREERVHRVVAKVRRADVDTLPDTVIDDGLSAALEVTPRVSLLGGAPGS